MGCMLLEDVPRNERIYIGIENSNVMFRTIPGEVDGTFELFGSFSAEDAVWKKLARGEQEWAVIHNDVNLKKWEKYISSASFTRGKLIVLFRPNIIIENTIRTNYFCNLHFDGYKVLGLSECEKLNEVNLNLFFE